MVWQMFLGSGVHLALQTLTPSGCLPESTFLWESRTIEFVFELDFELEFELSLMQLNAI